MNLKFWKKNEKSKFKRPNYYPKCTIFYSVLIKQQKSSKKDDYFNVSYVEYHNDLNNYCCEGFRKLFINYIDIKMKGRKPLKNLNLKYDLVWEMQDYNQYNTPFVNEVPIWYCPFCGARVETKRVQVKKEVTVKKTIEKIVPEKLVKVEEVSTKEVVVEDNEVKI